MPNNLLKLDTLQRMGNIARTVKKSVRDGWENTLTGLGVKGKDKRLGGRGVWSIPLETELEQTYASSDIAERVVDLLPAEALREGIQFKADESVDEDILKKFDDYMDALYVNERFQHAWSWGRLYGGAGIFLAIEDGRKLNEPVDFDNIKTVRSLVVLSRYELVSQDVDDDIFSSNFGLPRLYILASRQNSKQSSQEIHWTRLIRFDGKPLPRNLFIQNNYWGDSVLTRLFNSLNNYNLANDSAATILQDFRTSVLKLKDLYTLLQEADGKKLLEERIELMNLSRSVLNTVLLDSEDEELLNLTSTVTGIGEVLDRVEARLVAAADMPATVLLGVSPTGGLSGKGESENRDWYDRISHQQEQYLRPKLQYFFELLIRAKEGPSQGNEIEDFSFLFNPLWQQSDDEIADTRLKVAQTDALYIDRGVVDPTEVAKSRWGKGEYSMETTIDMEQRKLLEGNDGNEPTEDNNAS